MYRPSHEATQETPIDHPRTALRGVFVQLAEEHEDALGIVEALSATQNANEQRQLWSKLSTKLLAHERAELQEVYSAFVGYPALQVYVDEHAHQARSLQTQVGELNHLSMQTAEWHQGFQHLEVLIRQHVEQEEGTFFPRALEAIGDNKADELRIAYLSAKRNLLDGPSQRQPKNL